MKKKVFIFALMLVIACILAISISAVEVDGIFYTLDTGKMTATVSAENRTSGTLTEVVIPETVEYDNDGDGTKEAYVVTAIENSAFGAINGSDSPIVSVVVPKTVATIGNHAFRELKYLKTVVIKASGYNPETGETSKVLLSNAEFYKCPALVSVDMSESNVTQVGDNCFHYCSSLETVLFSSNIEKITAPFTGCSALTTINSLESVKYIGRGFYNTKIAGDIKLPNIETLGENAFRETGITSVDMSGSSLTEIGKHAFYSCTALTTVKLPSGLKTVNASAFQSCSSLTSVNLPGTVETLGDSAFRGAKIEGDIVLDNLKSLGNHALRETNIRSLVINGDITSLGTDASLYGCTQLEILVLPSTVTTAGANTFTNCLRLKYIVASERFTSVSSIPNNNVNIIITGNTTAGVASAFGGWAIAPFAEYDSTATKTIFYGAVPTVEATTFISFDGFTESFFKWSATTDEKTVYAPIFTASGYSTSDNNSGIAAAEPFIGNLLMSDNRFGLNYSCGTPVPVYAYIYHEYVRNFMGNQVGCPFDTRCDTLCYRLAYSFSIGDILTLTLSPSGELMTHWGTRDFENSPSMEKTLAFIKNLMKFYNDGAKKYLYAGKMSARSDFRCEDITLPLNDGREIKLPRLLSSCWEAENGQTAYVVVNPESTPVTFRIGSKGYEAPPLDALLLICDR